MRDTINVLGVNIDNISFGYALEKAKQMLKTDGTSMIFTPNPEIVMAAYEDPEFKEILNSADMCTPDGIGVVYAAKILGTPLRERVAGFDLACGLLESISKTGESVFLFGAKPGIAEAARDKLYEKYPGLTVAGVQNGYFSDEDNDAIKKTNTTRAPICCSFVLALRSRKNGYTPIRISSTSICAWVSAARSTSSAET